MTMTRGSAVLGFGLSFLAGVGFQYGVNRSRTHGSSPQTPSLIQASWSDADAAVPVSSQDPSRGDRAALVTLVAFSNFQCGYCRQSAKTLDELQKQYGRSKLRVVWKNAPPPKVRRVHVAAMTVHGLGGDEAFWRFHDRAFANMSNQDDGQFERWSEQAGVARNAFKVALAKGSYSAHVDDDIALAKKLGVSTTPRFFVNGIALRGAQSQAQFTTIIDTQLDVARTALKQGIAPENLYKVLSDRQFRAAPKPTP